MNFFKLKSQDEAENENEGKKDTRFNGMQCFVAQSSIILDLTHRFIFSASSHKQQQQQHKK
jgi:hypothetical protein